MISEKKNCKNWFCIITVVSFFLILYFFVGSIGTMKAKNRVTKMIASGCKYMLIIDDIYVINGTLGELFLWDSKSYDKEETQQVQIFTPE